MREWSLSSDSPHSLSIAADARLSIPKYDDDQIWELNLEGGEPPALAIETSYGLRAAGMRIYAGFDLGTGTVTDPQRFHSPPILEKFYPNFLQMSFRPFPNLRVQAQFWVLTSNVLAGRFLLHNLGELEQQVYLRLYALLKLGAEGSAMGEWQFKGVVTLAGQAGNIAPVLFLTGGAQADHSIHPALVLSSDVQPGIPKSITWVHAAFEERVASFDAARAAATQYWEAETAKVDLKNSAMLEIETGEPDWDVAIAITQNKIAGAYLGPTNHLPYPSFVNTRDRNRGYSINTNGISHNPSWNGQNVMDAYLQLPTLLPIAPEHAKGLIRNFLSVQNSDGEIDNKPGLGGQRGGVLCVPLLSIMVWMIYQQTEDREFLEEVFPGLLEFIEAWFTQKHDRDLDGHPEWDHTLHMGLDDCPTFVRWQPWGQGLDITKAETPDLASYLYRECGALIQIASLLQEHDAVPRLSEHRQRLRDAVEASWSDRDSSYHHVDRDVHLSTPGKKLGSGKGDFTLSIEKTFKQPIRLLIRCRGKADKPPPIKLFIHGRGMRGRPRIEQIKARHFQWFSGFGTATSDKTYKVIERIEVQGLGDHFKTEIRIADTSRLDVSLLLPLWAGIPDQARADQLILNTLLNQSYFGRKNGIAGCSANDPAYGKGEQHPPSGISMYWNLVIGEGLLNYGYRQEAAELVLKLMRLTTQVLQKEYVFCETYDPDQQIGYGERNHLSGVSPLSLFLRVLGIRIISPNKLYLRGNNPFPNPVTLRCKGLIVEFLNEQSIVTFPDGGRVEIRGDESQLVEQIID